MSKEDQVREKCRNYRETIVTICSMQYFFYGDWIWRIRRP